MASCFVVGDKFRERVAELLDKNLSSVPQGLREELEQVLERQEPTTLSFGVARKLKKCLLDNGDQISLLKVGDLTFAQHY